MHPPGKTDGKECDLPQDPGTPEHEPIRILAGTEDL